MTKEDISPDDLAGRTRQIRKHAKDRPSAPTPIPVNAAERIAKSYGYDQVIIYARRVGDTPMPHGEHLTTYGRNPAHCSAASRIGTFLKTKVMGWTADNGG